MKYTSNYKGIKSSSALDTDIQNTFEKFETYFDNDFSCHATVSHKGKGDDIKCVEITIKAGKYTFRAESTTDSFHKSVDENFEKIKKQIRRHKDKLISKKRNRVNIPEEAVFETDEDTTPVKVTRNKKFKVAPMSVEEAVLQMDLLDHNFFVFLNADTDEINVVYKRQDGDYGLIETNR